MYKRLHTYVRVFRYVYMNEYIRTHKKIGVFFYMKY